MISPVLNSFHLRFFKQFRPFSLLIFFFTPLISAGFKFLSFIHSFSSFLPIHQSHHLHQTSTSEESLFLLACLGVVSICRPDLYLFSVFLLLPRRSVDTCRVRFTSCLFAWSCLKGFSASSSFSFRYFSFFQGSSVSFIASSTLSSFGTLITLIFDSLFFSDASSIGRECKTFCHCWCRSSFSSLFPSSFGLFSWRDTAVFSLRGYKFQKRESLGMIRLAWKAGCLWCLYT